MSLRLESSKMSPNGLVRIEIWASKGDGEKLKDMAMSKFAPILKLAYPGRELERDSVRALLLLAFEKEPVGGMLIQAFGDDWTRTTELATYKEAVLPTRQRRGVGTQMLLALKEWAVDALADEDKWRIRSIRNAVDVDDVVGKAFMDKQEGFEIYEENDEEISYAWVNDKCPVFDFRL